MKTLIVIGGGAAGFFTAINAAQNNPNLTVKIFEKTNKLLSKVKISGGGRCNVTHHCFDINTLSKNYPRGNAFLKKAFFNFNTKDTVDWFKQRNIELKVEADGRMFPTTNNSQTIIDCFLQEAQNNNVEIWTNIAVYKIEKNNASFILHTNKEPLHADYVCIATGGAVKSEQLHWVQNIDEVKTNTVNPVPSLFTFNIPNNDIVSLQGIAVTDCIVKILGTKLQQQGAALITHWGLSGPAILKLSAFAALELSDKNYDFSVSINWLPQFNETAFLTKWKNLIPTTNQTTGNFNPFNVPNRLWTYLLQKANIDTQTKWATITKEKINLFVKLLTNMELQVKGKTTFKEEFVTAGGIDLAQINHITMEHKLIKNLFFAGEILNIDGITGGFNFQNAWTTGFVAAKTIKEKTSI